jgi:hypothetical protein
LVSMLCGITGSLLSAPLDDELVSRMFDVQPNDSSASA